MYLNIPIYSTLILNVMSSQSYPKFYALDVGDGQGMQLLPSWGKNCPFYRSKISVVKEDGILYLFKSASVWYISKKASVTKTTGCPKINSKGKLLFTLPDLDTLHPQNGWHNITRANLIVPSDKNVIPKLRKVEACKIYTNAYFKFTSRVTPSDAENFEDCKDKAYSKYAEKLFTFTSDYFLISTKTNYLIELL